MCVHMCELLKHTACSIGVEGGAVNQPSRPGAGRALTHSHPFLLGPFSRPSRISSSFFPISHTLGNHKPIILAMNISTDLPYQNMDRVSLRKDSGEFCLQIKFVTHMDQGLHSALGLGTWSQLVGMLIQIIYSPGQELICPVLCCVSSSWQNAWFLVQRL